MIDVWNAALKKLESVVNRELMDDWFSPMECIEVTDSLCVLEIETDFRRDWVNSNYLDLIEGVVQDITVSTMHVEVRSAESRLRQINEDPLEKEISIRQSTPANFRGSFPPNDSSDSHNKNESFHFVNNSNHLDTNLPHDDFVALARSHNLNPHYTFEEFVVGPSNQLIAAAAKTVASDSRRYNPLFIFGNVGLGKTHILHSIGNRLLQNNPNIKIICTSAEDFMNEMIMAINNNDMPFFRELYRQTCDLLLIDDVQFLKGKTSTQGEFFHTFNALYESGKQIVLTSDLPPHLLNGLDQRLTSRFASGLSADILLPDFETKLQIVHKKALLDDISLSHDVASLIAEHAPNNIRELEGFLIALEAQSSLNHRKIDLPFTRELLSRFGVHQHNPISVERIINAVATFFSISPNDILGRSRTKNISIPRQIAMFLARLHTNLSFPEIGRQFGGKDHTTVIAAFRKFEHIVASQHPEYLPQINAIERSLSLR